MRVFISWSGPRSKEVGEALRDWLPDVLHSVTPFMSTVDIHKGREFTKVLRTELAGSDFGVLCLTKDNRRSPWLLFESGALATVVDDPEADKPYLCPYLIDMEPTDLPGPLVNFQAATADEAGTRDLVRSLNSANNILKLSESQVRKSFDHWWPDLKPKLESRAKPVGPPVEADDFFLINVETATVLRALGQPHKNGELLELASYSGARQDVWRLHEVEKAYYAVVSKHTDQCLDVEGSSPFEKAKIHQWEFRNGDNQKWALVLQMDGSYKIQAKHSGKYLTVTGDGIKQKGDPESPAQRWWVVPVF